MPACRTINQGWYSYYSCMSGWFGPNAPPVRNTVVLKVRAIAVHAVPGKGLLEVSSTSFGESRAQRLRTFRAYCFAAQIAN